MDLVGVAGVPLERNNHSEVTSDLEVTLGVLVTVRNDDLGALRGQLGNEVASQEASAAENSRNVTRNRRTTADGSARLGDRNGLVTLGLVQDGKVVSGLCTCQLAESPYAIPQRTRVAMRGAREAATFVRRTGAARHGQFERAGTMAFGRAKSSPKRTDAMVAAVACV